MHTVDSSVEQASVGQANHSSEKVPSGAAKDDYLSAFDLTQDDPDIIHLAGLDIHEESKMLSVKMRHLSDEELRVTSVQVQLTRICSIKLFMVKDTVAVEVWFREVMQLTVPHWNTVSMCRDGKLY